MIPEARKLVQQWKERADGYESTASAYKSKCQNRKKVELIGKAHVVRMQIRELQALIDACDAD